jgi:uroporphyrinogen-III decarboxylase
MSNFIGGFGVNSKDRMSKALSLQKLDRAPAAPAYLGLYLADFIRQAYVQQYEKRVRKSLHYGLNHAQDSLFRAEAIRAAYKQAFKVMPDWVFTTLGPTREWASRMEMRREKDSFLYFDKSSGDSTTDVPGFGPSVTDYVVHQDRPSAKQDIWDTSDQIGSIEELEKHITLVSKKELDEKGLGELPKHTKEIFGDDYFIYSVIDTPFSYLYDILGFRGMMVNLYQDPGLVKYLQAKILEQSLEFIKLFKSVGVDGVYIEEVYTSADIISPESYEEFVYPFNKQYIREIKEIGLKTILYVCGDIIPRLERIGCLGADALAFEESKKNFEIDLEDIIQRVGEGHCIFGNIDTIKFGTKASKDEMAEEVRKQISLGMEADGFIVSNGSPFPLETDPGHIDTMVQTAHEHIYT